MCHALFLVYTCVQGSCFATYGSCGTTGHGAAWQYVAYAVEHTSLPVLGLRFNLNRRNASGHEGGHGRPSIWIIGNRMAQAAVTMSLQDLYAFRCEEM